MHGPTFSLTGAGRVGGRAAAGTTLL